MFSSCIWFTSLSMYVIVNRRSSSLEGLGYTRKEEIWDKLVNGMDKRDPLYTVGKDGDFAVAILT